MNRYKEKQEAKRERLRERAAKQEAKASAASRDARRIMDAIPPGQPILIGHHSEKRHRRDLGKLDRSMRTSVDSAAYAENLRQRAEGLGTHGISSDDPEAVDQLKAKLANMEASQNEMKAVNKAYKKGGWEQCAAEGLLTDRQVDALKNSMAIQSWHSAPFPPYALKNNNGNMRRVKQRIAELEARADKEPRRREGDGWVLEEDFEDNRTRITFDSKPDDETRKKLKGAGFRWARSIGAWQRHMSTQAWYLACDLLEVSYE